MARKPRIITETIAFLRELADEFESGLLVTFVDGDTNSERAARIRDHADKLGAYDARETRLDPSKRKAKKRAAKR